ncbi:MAG TPA: FAD-dependent oxidoreductase [Chthoniobacterales bacterium]|nr:FAD-dependent oxidoreductase [Chthoniobacterales bacterium]
MIVPLLCVLLAASPATAPASADICVYGGTSAGVIAAVQARKMGKSVILVSPSRHLGGLTSGGLGFTDMGNPRTVGGLTRDFFHRIWSHYQNPGAWTVQTKDSFPNHGQHGPAFDSKLEIATVFEPHVAEKVFGDLLAANAGVAIVPGRLAEKDAVRKIGRRIVSIHLEDGRQISARMFIDASYEGDLMAAAGVSFTVGRESNAQYGESIDGIRAPSIKNQLPKGIDPYLRPGNPASGLLPGVNADAGGPIGSADQKIQAYCYRMCLTDAPRNRLPIAKPAGYRESDYELVFRAIEKGQTRGFFKLSALPNRKTDSNNDSGISTDFIGQNYDYPEASYAQREKIDEAHRQWQLGLIWTLQNHPRVPESIRKFYGPWGLPRDEFTDTDHWSDQLYIREARRMVGLVVLTEPLLIQGAASHPIGMGSYQMDSHNVQRIATRDGVENEGDVQHTVPQPYQIDYDMIVPKAGECGNLLVPVCMSASHVAYGSIRMEPVFMILGQSAATAAALSIDSGTTVQKLDAQKLASRLEADGQVLQLPPAG